MHFPYESVSGGALTITENTQGHTFSDNMVGIPMTINYVRMRRDNVGVVVAGPANHEMHVTGAHPANGRHVRLELSTTRSWTGSHTSSFLYVSMTRLGSPIPQAPAYHTEVCVRHACGLSVYRVKVFGSESAAVLWKRADRVAPRMSAGPAFGRALDYDDVAVSGQAYSLVPGVTDVSLTPGAVLIRPRAYWSTKFENLVLSVLTNAARADLRSWPECAAGAAVRQTDFSDSGNDDDYNVGESDEEDDEEEDGPVGIV